MCMQTHFGPQSNLYILTDSLPGIWWCRGGAYLIKKEAAADEEGEVDVVVMGAGSPAWLEPLTRQGARVLLPLVVMVVTEASKAVTSVSASPIKPQAC